MRPLPKPPFRFLPHAKSPALAGGLPAWRSALILAVITAAFCALAGRAWWIQIVEHDFHLAQGQKRYRQTFQLDAPRGPIVDRHGSLLAISLTTYEIWGEPQRIEPAAQIPLARALGMAPEALQARLGRTRSFVLLKREVDAETAKQIAAMNLAGVSQMPSSKRIYPEGEAAAHVVGFTGIDDTGQEGIELAANARLAGQPGAREVIRDRLGRVVSDLRPLVAARNGATVRLTIDRRIQQLAYAELKASLERHKAQAGSVVVLDARSGEVLALVNAPSFDPNARDERRGLALRNRALTDTFEPGSTIKPLLIATALDAGIARPTTLIQTAPGTYSIGPNTIHDTSNHGTITVTQALTKSSNVALAKLALSLPAETIWTTYQQYGIGQAPALPFPGVAAGKLRPWQRWRPIEQATIGYGYGFSASLMQVAQAYTVLAGDGTLRTASLLLEDGKDTLPGIDAGLSPMRVTTPETAAALRTMLEATTGDDATGRSAKVEGYRVGGKTGTAWKHAGGSYAKGKYRALFAGMAPMSDPRIIVAVMLDEPTGRSYYGGAVAAPLFASVAGGALQLLGVPPDDA
jgi:cell division protein FtsI (penicillin-binding protein 3)